MLKTKLLFLPFFIALTLPAQTVRFQTSLGGIDVVLTPTPTPLTVANFMNYVNSGAYNNTIIHRSLPVSAAVAPYIIQGGGYALGAANIPYLIPQNPPITNEFNSASCPCNIAGTIAMAQFADEINSATDQWYFNVADNSGTLDSQSFVVFGAVANAPSLAVATSINSLPVYTADYSQDADFVNLPLVNYSCPNPTCPLIKADNFITVYSIAQLQPAVTGIANAATALNNNGTGISPGEIITLYGTNLGPCQSSTAVTTTACSSEVATTLALDSAGLVTSSLAGTQVLFNGVPGPMIFTEDGQAAVVVPYEIAGQNTVSVVVSYLGAETAPIQFKVVPANPGLFTLNYSGQGDAAILRLNSDGTVSGINASSPASVGDFLELYGQGYGVASPSTSLPDGAVVGSTLPLPAATTVLLIDGQPVTTQYAGGAGDDVNGVMQINFYVPQLAPGAHQIQVKVGSAVSPAGVTLQTH